MSDIIYGCNPYRGSNAFNLEAQVVYLTQIVNNLIATVNGGGGGTTSSVVYGRIVFTVGGASNLVVFNPYSIATTTTASAGTTYTNTLLGTYNIAVYNNGTGILIPGVNYSFTGNVITKLGSGTFTNGEVYYIDLYTKLI